MEQTKQFEQTSLTNSKDLPTIISLLNSIIQIRTNSVFANIIINDKSVKIQTEEHSQTFDYKNYTPPSIMLSSPNLKNLNVRANSFNNLDFSDCRNLEELIINSEIKSDLEFGKKLNYIVSPDSENYTFYGCNCRYQPLTAPETNTQTNPQTNTQTNPQTNTDKLIYDYSPITPCRCDTNMLMCRCVRQDGCICINPNNCRCFDKCVCLPREKCVCSLWCFCQKTFSISPELMKPLGTEIYSELDGHINVRNCHKLKKFVFNVNKTSNELIKNHDYKIITTPLQFSTTDNVLTTKSFYSELEHLELSSDYDLDLDFDSFGSNMSYIKYKAQGNILSAQYLNFNDHVYNGKFSNLKYFEFSNPQIRYLDISDTIQTIKLINLNNIGLDLNDAEVKKLYELYKLDNQKLKKKPILDLTSYPELINLEVIDCPNLSQINFSSSIKLNKINTNCKFNSFVFDGIYHFFINIDLIKLNKKINNLTFSNIQFNSIVQLFEEYEINNLILNNIIDDYLDFKNLKINSLKITNSNVHSIDHNELKALYVSNSKKFKHIKNKNTINSLSIINCENYIYKLFDYPNLNNLLLSNIKDIECCDLIKGPLNLTRLELININSSDEFKFNLMPELKYLNLDNFKNKSNQINLNSNSKLETLIIKTDQTFIMPSQLYVLQNLIINSNTYNINQTKYPNLLKLDITSQSDINLSKIDLTKLIELKLSGINKSINVEVNVQFKQNTLDLHKIKKVILSNILNIESLDCVNSPVEYILVENCINLNKINSTNQLIKFLRLMSCPKLDFKINNYTLNLIHLEIDNIDYLITPEYNSATLYFNHAETIHIINKNKDHQITNLTIYYKKLRNLKIIDCDNLNNFTLRFSESDVDILALPKINNFYYTFNSDLIGNSQYQKS